MLKNLVGKRSGGGDFLPPRVALMFFRVGVKDPCVNFVVEDGEGVGEGEISIDNKPEWAHSLDMTHGEVRVIEASGCGAHQDAHLLRSPPMGCAARELSTYPLRGSIFTRDESIGGLCPLEDYVWAVLQLKEHEATVEHDALPLAHPFMHSDTSVSQFLNSTTGYFRVRVLAADDYLTNAGLNDEIGTRRGFAEMRARLKRYIDGGIFQERLVDYRFDGENFRVWAAVLLMVPLADDRVAADDDSANHGVGHNGSTAASGEVKGAVHEAGIYHGKCIPRDRMCGYPAEPTIIPMTGCGPSCTLIVMNSSTSQPTPDRAIVWSPPASLLAECAMTRFIKVLEAHGYGSFATHEDLHQWSVTDPHTFWKEVVAFVGMHGEGTLEPLWDLRDGPTPLAKRWFPSFRINFAENLLQSADDSTAITAWSEGRLARKITRAELKDLSLSLARYLKGIGIGSSDRIFAYLPNIPEAIVCMLGSAAIGATWASCGTDYQVDGLLARLGRVQPKVFIAPLSYLWRGKEVDASQTIIDVVRETPSIQHVILVDYLGGGDARKIREADLKVGWGDLVTILAAKSGPVQLEKFSFSHPLYIMFSSGTTGKPKGIVHAAGGTLLEHKKEHILHSDVRPGDVLFYQTSTSWMMWNWLVSGLAAQATIALYDGDPLLEDGTILWRMAEQERFTHFGTSAAFLGAIEKQGFGRVKNSRFDRSVRSFRRGQRCTLRNLTTSGLQSSRYGSRAYLVERTSSDASDSAHR